MYVYLELYNAFIYYIQGWKLADYYIQGWKLAGSQHQIRINFKLNASHYCP